MSLPNIIGLSGYAQAGKDTVGTILGAAYGYRRIAFADKLKAMALLADPMVDYRTETGWDYGYGGDAYEVVDVTPVHLSEAVESYGWERAKGNPEVRGFLQNLGVAARETFGEDFWVEQAFASLGKSLRVVITDVRFANEFRTIKERGGQVWRIEREGVTPPNLHRSETDILDFPFDAVVQNNDSIASLTHRVSDYLTLLEQQTANA